MKDYSTVSRLTVNRLTLYFRELRYLQNEGKTIISSEKLGEHIGVSSEQIRKDLAKFGSFGKKGVGYDIHDLTNSISRILGLHRKWNLAFVGVGHPGWALVNNGRILSKNFRLRAIFDSDPTKIGTYINNIEVSGMENIEAVIRKRNIKIVGITSIAYSVQGIVDKLISAGVAGIWNFVPTKLSVPENIILVNEDLSAGLTGRTYRLIKEENIPRHSSWLNM